MKLNLIKANGDIITGQTLLANDGTTIGAVFRHDGADFVVVSRPQLAPEISALEIQPMALDETNFTVGSP